MILFRFFIACVLWLVPQISFAIELPLLNKSNENVLLDQRFPSFFSDTGVNEQSSGSVSSRVQESSQVTSCPGVIRRAGGVSRAGNVARGAARSSGKLPKISNQLKNWLGKEYRVITNKAGDTVLLSKDGLRKMRWNVKNPHGYDPHMHLEVLKNGEWLDAVPGKHHLYLKK